MKEHTAIDEGFARRSSSPRSLRVSDTEPFLLSSGVVAKYTDILTRCSIGGSALLLSSNKEGVHHQPKLEPVAGHRIVTRGTRWDPTASKH